MLPSRMMRTAGSTSDGMSAILRLKTSISRPARDAARSKSAILQPAVGDRKSGQQRFAAQGVAMMRREIQDAVGKGMGGAAGDAAGCVMREAAIPGKAFTGSSACLRTFVHGTDYISRNQQSPPNYWNFGLLTAPPGACPAGDWGVVAGAAGKLVAKKVSD